jgi:multimeric flavodoxin WrbA
MYCLVLNGNPEPSAFDDYLESFTTALQRQGHQSRRIDLRCLDVKYCNGCWSCWWATPGLCARNDDMVSLYPELVKADLVVWASPLILGAITSLLKKVQERFIPLAHPYVLIADGECHHHHRYAHNADIGLIVGPTADDTEEDLTIARALFQRFSLNTRTRLKVFATPATPIEEVIHDALAA